VELTDVAVGSCTHDRCGQAIVHLMHAEDSEAYWLEAVTGGEAAVVLHWPEEIADPLRVWCPAHVPPVPWIVTHRDIQTAMVHWMWGRRTQRLALRRS
jgi:hypothetical protein